MTSSSTSAPVLECFCRAKNNPAIVADRTGVESFELAAEVMRFQPGVTDVRRHAPQGSFDLRLERGILCDQTTERSLEPGREDELVLHGSLEVAQPGNDGFRRLGLELA